MKKRKNNRNYTVGSEAKLTSSFIFKGGHIPKGDKVKITGLWSKGITVIENGTIIPIPFKFLKLTKKHIQKIKKYSEELLRKGLGTFVGMRHLNTYDENINSLDSGRGEVHFIITSPEMILPSLSSAFSGYQLDIIQTGRGLNRTFRNSGWGVLMIGNLDMFPSGDIPVIRSMNHWMAEESPSFQSLLTEEMTKVFAYLGNNHPNTVVEYVFRTENDRIKFRDLKTKLGQIGLHSGSISSPSYAIGLDRLTIDQLLLLISTLEEMGYYTDPGVEETETNEPVNTVERTDNGYELQYRALSGISWASFDDECLPATPAPPPLEAPQENVAVGTNGGYVFEDVQISVGQAQPQNASSSEQAAALRQIYETTMREAERQVASDLRMYTSTVRSGRRNR